MVGVRVGRFGYVWRREFLSETIARISRTTYWVFAKLFLTHEYRWYDKSEDAAEEDAVGGSFFDEKRGWKLDQNQYTKKRQNALLGERAQHDGRLLTSQGHYAANSADCRHLTPNAATASTRSTLSRV